MTERIMSADINEVTLSMIRCFIKGYLKDVLSPLLFNSSLEYVIRKVQENQYGLELNGTDKLLVYADDAHLLGENINTMKKNIEILSGSSKEVDQEMNEEKTKQAYMFHVQPQQCGKYHNIKIPVGNKYLKNVALLQYLGLTVTHKSFIHEEVKRRLNWGNDC
jgi:hypothetical protein